MLSLEFFIDTILEMALY